MKDLKDKLGYEIPRLMELNLGNIAFGAGGSPDPDNDADNPNGYNADDEEEG